MTKNTNYHGDPFWSKVGRRGEDECWPYQGGRDKDGYGREKRNGRKWYAHRLAHFLATGKQPPTVRHRCDNRCCCNPHHLEGGTQQDNIRDRQERERQARGAQNGRAKLNEQRVRMIKRQLLQGVPQAELARTYGVSTSVIRDIKREKTWRHVSPLERVEVPQRDEMAKAA